MFRINALLMGLNVGCTCVDPVMSVQLVFKAEPLATLFALVRLLSPDTPPERAQ